MGMHPPPRGTGGAEATSYAEEGTGEEGREGDWRGKGGRGGGGGREGEAEGKGGELHPPTTNSWIRHCVQCIIICGESML